MTWRTMAAMSGAEALEEAEALEGAEALEEAFVGAVDIGWFISC